MEANGWRMGRGPPGFQIPLCPAPLALTRPRKQEASVTGLRHGPLASPAGGSAGPSPGSRAGTCAHSASGSWDGEDEACGCARRWAEPQGPRWPRSRWEDPEVRHTPSEPSAQPPGTHQDAAGLQGPAHKLHQALRERRGLEGRESQTHAPGATGSRELGPAAPTGLEDSVGSALYSIAVFL